ncbi:MAG TPA: hypothetical protein VLA91_09770 [Acidimicrobiia bacterium]|nr:hypothetical protein [Acidimicrobiia bacterium]
MENPGLMIIELIGPGAVGKSTVGPILAARLGISHYAGQGFYGLDGEPLGAGQIWFDRLISAFADPGLTIAALRILEDPLRSRLSFALTTSRRERFARRAQTTGSGVFSSGPVHWLCQESTRYQQDLTGLLSRVVLSDVYVRLSADPEVVTRRLAGRGGKTESRVAEHPLWIDRYQGYADQILATIGRPVVEVVADGPAEQVADEIVTRLAAVTGRKGS